MQREFEVTSTLQASRRSMHGADYDSVINVRICCNGVPGRTGHYDQDISAANENQAWVQLQLHEVVQVIKFVL